MDLTAAVKSDIGIDRVELSYSPAEDIALGEPVLMEFAGYDPVSGIYNYTYRLLWTATSIRIQIIAQDSDGVRSEPFVTSQAWSVTTDTQIMFAGGPGVWALAAVVAAGSLGAAAVLRWLLRARAS